ncbi:MAG TPA: ABC transporter substrate-binding protein, partial [Myxococcota bacterium]
EALSKRALADARVRRALALAIDVDTLIHDKLRDRAVRATGLLPAGHWAKDARDVALPFDPVASRRLLDDAGFPARGERGRFHVALATTTDRLRRATALVIADEWRAVGVAVDVQVRDWSALYEDIQRGAFDAFSAQWVPVLEPDLMHWVYASSSIPQPGRAGGNRSGYRDADVDRWLEAARNSDDEAVRRPLYLDAQERVARDLPLLPLWFEDQVAVRSTRVLDFKLSRIGSLLPIANARLAPAAAARP